MQGPLVSQGDLGLGREDRGMLGYHSYSFLDQGGGLRFLEVFCAAYRPFQAFPAFSPQQGVGKGEPIVWKEEVDISFPSLPAPATRQQEGGLGFLLVRLVLMHRAGFCLPGPFHTVGQADRSICYSSPF